MGLTPINPNHPSLWYLPPTCALPETAEPLHNTGYHYKARYKLPDGVTCQNCVLQWWWAVGGGCIPGGYEGFKELPGVDLPGECTSSQSRSGWYNSYTGNSMCGVPDDRKIRQEFWNW